MQRDLDNQLLSHLRGIAGKGGVLSYRKYIEEVLFAPELGYYRRDVERVGRKEETDFYTAESLGSVFGELVKGAVQKILGEEECRKSEFIEIGAEGVGGLMKGLDFPFAGYKTIRVGQEIKIPKNAVVFANELLDAQAFHRLIYQNGKWWELGVRVDGNGLREEVLSQVTLEVEEILDSLPTDVQERYRLDLPLGAESLLKRIVEEDWNGMILLFDYGFLWEDLMHNYPEGTGRAYYKHKQYSDLLINVGRQDITCHVCWDRLSKILQENGFQRPYLQKQESFFVHHAINVIEGIINKRNGKYIDVDRMTLNELLHPAHMGHKFQVLWAIRG